MWLLFRRDEFLPCLDKDLIDWSWFNAQSKSTDECVTPNYQTKM